MSLVASALLMAVFAQPTARTRPSVVRKDSVKAAVVASRIDSTTARRICERPDSVIAGRSGCVLRDQAPHIVKVF